MPIKVHFRNCQTLDSADSPHRLRFAAAYVEIQRLIGRDCEWLEVHCGPFPPRSLNPPRFGSPFDGVLVSLAAEAKRRAHPADPGGKEGKPHESILELVKKTHAPQKSEMTGLAWY